MTKRITRPPMKTGRPPEYRPEFCEQVVQHMRGVNSFESFSDVVGVERTTLYNWCKQYPDFLYARKRGREALQRQLENVSKGLFMGKIKGNVAALIFFMKNTTSWRDEPGTMEEDMIDGLHFNDGD